MRWHDMSCMTGDVCFEVADAAVALHLVSARIVAAFELVSVPRGAHSVHMAMGPSAGGPNFAGSIAPSARCRTQCGERAASN
jgi:hypothetical protein